MKILHCADLHLDSEMKHHFDSQTAKRRREELLETFEKMVAYAAEEDVRLILIAGDMFDVGNSVRKKAVLRVREQIASHPEIDFLYLQGNHDRSTYITDLLLKDEALSNLKQFREDEWTSYDYGEVVVSGIELTEENSGEAGNWLNLDSERTNIVMLHGQVSEYASDGDAELIFLPALRGKSIDYLALGHIHSYREDPLDERGVYCYSGCLEGRGFDECGEKGCVLLEVSGGGVIRRFLPMASRQIREISVEINPEMPMLDVVTKAKEAVASLPSCDMIKLIVKGRREMDMTIDVDRLWRSVEANFFFVKVVDETMIAIDYESFANDRSLKGEFVRLMQQQEEFDEETRSAVIALGIQAIMGEELEL